MIYKIEVAGYKNWRMVDHGKWTEIEGEYITKTYKIEANSREEAEYEAIKKFENERCYFEEVVV